MHVRYAVWPDPRSESSSRALKVGNSAIFKCYFQLHNGGADKWPRILKLGGQYLSLAGIRPRRSAARRRRPTSIAYSRTERTSTICDDDRSLRRGADRSPRQQWQSAHSAAQHHPWNSLPKTVLDSDTVTSFKSRLKTRSPLLSRFLSYSCWSYVYTHTTWPKRLRRYYHMAL